MRTSRQWIVVIGGDEIVFHRKDLALLSTAAAQSTFPDIRLLERTTLRFRSGCGLNVTEQSFDIDITDRIKDTQQ